MWINSHRPCIRCREVAEGWIISSLSSPWWNLPLVCHLLVWPVQNIVYTWRWDQASECEGYHCISCGPNWNNLHCRWNLCRHLWSTQHEGFCQNSATYKVFAYISGKGIWMTIRPSSSYKWIIFVFWYPDSGREAYKYHVISVLGDC